MYNAIHTNTYYSKTNEVLDGLHTKGYVLLKDFPENAIFPLLESIGSVFEQDAGLQHAVKYESGFDDYRYSKSMNEIGPHTEFPYYSVPPRIQVLYCVTPAVCGGGQTYLCSIKKFLDQLSEGDREILATYPINFSANKDLQGMAQKNVCYPLLQQMSDSFIFRFSHNLLYYGDVNAKIAGQRIDLSKNIQNIIDMILGFLETEKIECMIPKHGLLLWHNHSVLHWRTRYQDKNRHLIRYLLK